MEPSQHDFATAAISHLPHVISATLVNLVEAEDGEDELLKTIAAGGFRDITRISSSSPVMWQNICLSNRDAILRLMDLYSQSFISFRKAVEEGEADTLIKFFQSAKDYRDSLPIRKKGLLPASFEFFCDLADEAGQIATIASILASNALNIKNIGIIHNREFEEGVLSIEMYDHESMDRAIALLKKHQYTIHLKK